MNVMSPWEAGDHFWLVEANQQNKYQPKVQQRYKEKEESISFSLFFLWFDKLLKFFKIQFSISIVVKSLHDPFNLEIKFLNPQTKAEKKFEMNDLITCFGLIVLCILANSSFVMNPSLSLSSA